MRLGSLRTVVGVPTVATIALLWLAGCMVGPDYKQPPAPLSDQWRDPESDAIERDATSDLAEWWKVLSDPTLDELVHTAYLQNPNLETAAMRVLEARARRGIAYGLLFPQDQFGFGGYTRTQLSKNQAGGTAGGERSFDDWQLGAAASWELDIWGRFRRGIESADADVMSAVASYDDVLVTLISDVATQYISIRILQERLAITLANVEIQRRGLTVAEDRLKGGTATELDRAQALTLLRDTEAIVPDIEAGIVQGQNQLCVLLGIPPKDLDEMLGERGIPAAPASVAVGVPADLMRRRPDVRRAERDLAAQSARIGIAKTDLYPSFFLTGDVRVASDSLSNLFEGDSVQAFGGPSFRWNLLNYRRIHNAVRVEDARFQALIGVYESTVLAAQADVENAIAAYLGAQRQVALLSESVKAAQRAVEIAETQYKGGTADYTRVLLTQDNLQTEQDRLVTTRGAVALNLVSLYRALGGGWELRPEDHVPINDETREQMRERTDWGKYLD